MRGSDERVGEGYILRLGLGDARTDVKCDVHTIQPSYTMCTDGMTSGGQGGKKCELPLAVIPNVLYTETRL